MHPKTKIFLFLLCLPTLGLTQDTLSVKLIARSDGEAIRLRWAPKNINTWELGNKHGYKLLRRTVKANGVYLSSADFQNSVVELGHFQLASQATWEELIEEDSLALLAAMALFAEEFQLHSAIEEGDYVSMINQEKTIENRYGYSLFAADHSFRVAKAMGLGFEDEAANPGDQYFYQLIPNILNKEAVLDTAMVSISHVKTSSLPQPEITNARFGDKLVELDIRLEGLEAFYTSYNIYRSETKSGAWQKINAYPVLINANEGGPVKVATYMDSLEANFEVYQFRIAGNTPFGEEGPYSEIVSGSGRPGPILLQLGIPVAYEATHGKIQINWQADQKWNKQLRGWEIYRMAGQDKSFQSITPLLLDPEIRSFIDEQAGSSNYYIITAVDENQHRISSTRVLAQLKDEQAPTPPILIQGQIDSFGVVNLQWEDNPETDLLGYRVYRSYRSYGDFFQITHRNQRENSFTDTIRLDNLTDTVFYKLIALDRHQNFSPFSEVVAILKPDFIPPAAPIFKSYTTAEAGVGFHWALSSSKDVKGYQLQRKARVDGEWNKVFSFDSKQAILEYRDSTGAVDSTYLYRLVAFDDAGLSTASPEILAKKVDRKVEPAIDQFSGDYLKDRRSIELSWPVNSTSPKSEFFIYRSRENVALSLLKIVNGSSCQKEGLLYRCRFVDSKIAPGQSYQYKILGKNEKGRLSRFSEAVEVVAE